MNEKEEIIKEAYEKDFGTANETYEIAAKKSPNIRLQDVKDYLNKLESVQFKFKYNKYNNCVSSGANFEFEVDIMVVLARDGVDGIRHGFCAIDKFTKMASVIPINNRKPSEIIMRIEVNI